MKNDRVLWISISLLFRGSDCQPDFQRKQRLESHVVHTLVVSFDYSGMMVEKP